MARRLRLPRLMRDLRDQEDVDRLMRERPALDVGSPLFPDTRLSALPALGAPVVSLVASDHIVRVAKPNRKPASSEMKHHRVDH